ncbi:DUF1697 domain-containing protein [Frigoribacterium faeni]|uniref:Uncharacterized protein (DUF1697 family) n=1 Tax=Frigoribacterium faeni TaxID=145483 RepID=A0A7W3PJ16_9MICO|nr:DUF1697 domain-containing protein [Frigoribacterium faeni]MBA8813269.1 uncharacterized protein (DUF1697 family) [Frigoribacterium faeni]BFF14483.1 DUF1697 domain-containing protein [Microbacterium flavescens]GEK82921.1 hypothetical protein FFA01_12300 [Frigoribacterium faeni]
MDHVALLRGVNVGTAKRLAMADLRRVAADLGHARPETVLNSGNLVFDSASLLRSADVRRLRDAIAAATGVDAELVVLDAETFVRLVDANPLRRDGREPARLSVGFAEAGAGLDGLAPPSADLGDEELVVADGAVYQWLPHGVLASRVPAGWWRAVPVTVTARNDATLRRIRALLARRGD